jgi:hypothetical protein
MHEMQTIKREPSSSSTCSSSSSSSSFSLLLPLFIRFLSSSPLPLLFLGSNKLEEELKRKYELLFRKFETERALRRSLHNVLIELRGNIRVHCRVRPPLFLLGEESSQTCLKVLDDESLSLASSSQGKEEKKKKKEESERESERERERERGER